jgi:uncharacterized protein (DUF433 family)
MQHCSASRTHSRNIPQVRAVGYTSASMGKIGVPRTEDDVRDYPSYSIEDVAHYLGVPVRTLRSWVRGYSYKTSHGVVRVRPLIEPADPKRNLLSFFNLAETQVLAATREKDIPTRRVRRAVEYLRSEEGWERPLLTHVFHRYGQNLFVKELGAKRLRAPLNVSQYGQYGIKQVLKRYLHRIELDPKGRPILVYPLRPGQKDKRKLIAINPLVSSGRPALRGSGIMAEVIWNRAIKGNEPIPEIARDFRLKPSEIKAAIKYFQRAA